MGGNVPRIWKFGNSINTDDILPGKYAPYMVGEDNFQSYAFAHLRPEFAANVEAGDILLAAKNWGLGSSREYAPKALKKLNVGAIIAQSFARIHYRNLVNLGIPAFISEQAYSVFSDGENVSFDFDNVVLSSANHEIRLEPIPKFLQESLELGSVLEYYKKYRRFPSEGIG